MCETPIETLTLFSLNWGNQGSCSLICHKPKIQRCLTVTASHPHPIQVAQGGFEEVSAAYEAELELRSKGIPKNCACGAETEIVNSVGPLHAGRKFFSCPNYDDRNEHMWKGVDKAMMEEFAKQSQELKDVKEELTSVKYDVGDIAFKMHFLTVGDSKEVMDDLKNAHDEINVLKERMVKFDDEIGELNKKSLKINVLFVVATVIVIVALLMSYKC